MRLELDRQVHALRAAPADFFMNEWNQHIPALSWGPLASQPIAHGEMAESADEVRTVEHLRLQLYLETAHHPCNLTCNVVLVVLGSLGTCLTDNSCGIPGLRCSMCELAQ